MVAVKRAFKRSADSLDEIFAFVRGYFSAEKLPETHLETINLVVEELFINLVKHSKDGKQDILIGLSRNGDELAVSLTDFDVEPFDINQRPPVRTDRPLSERRPGGLGIHLIKKMVDRIDYDYADRTSTTTIIKNLR